MKISALLVTVMFASLEYSLPRVFTVFMLFWHQVIVNFMFSLSSKNDDVTESFCRFLKISYHSRNRHHQLSLHTKFQLNILFCYQDIGNIMLSLSSNDDVIKFDLFCQLIRISLP